MAALQHPNIVDVIEVGEEEGVRYFAMQYIEGEGLEETIRREGALSPERAVEIAAQVADGLQHAYERGVIHRDIKPGNILITAEGRAVVTDFGIAKAVEGMDEGHSLTQGAIGTPEYMSPEVIKGNPVDGRTDIYSLGIVLYQMVSGQAPFTATTPYQVADRHLREPPRSPSSFGSNCPDWLESIILKALAKDPSDRFNSAAEMAAALRSARPVAPPTTEFVTPDELRSSAGAGGAARPRHRALIIAAGTAGLLLIAAAIFIRAQMGAGDAHVAGAVSDTATTRPTSEMGIGEGESPQQVSATTVPADVTLPRVVGLQQGNAEQRLLDAGELQVQYNDPRYSEAYGAGRIISQYPEGGTEVEYGTVVTLVVSRGEPPPQPVHDAQIATWTSHRRATESDLAGHSNWMLTLMRNEIYARHGRTFVTNSIQQYFDRQSWYSRDPGYTDARVSRTEAQNAVFIREYQVRHFGRPATRP